ncbi:G-I-Y-Y-I-G endonuclease [Mycobacterium phage Mova]|nr:G-I-Y-Y-I-G endonuclease [Mycobacterium phage Mova]
MEVPMSDKPHILYRFYNAEDELLYIGITNNPRSRFNQHHADKAWFKSVARATMQHFATRAELETAEVAAIQSELPRYNAAHAVHNKGELRPKSISRRPISPDANKFQAPDAITSDAPTVEDREKRMDEIEEQISRIPRLIPGERCTSCEMIMLALEYDGLVKCLNCLNMWTPDELQETL